MLCVLHTVLTVLNTTDKHHHNTQSVFNCNHKVCSENLLLKDPFLNLIQTKYSQGNCYVAHHGVWTGLELQFIHA